MIKKVILDQGRADKTSLRLKYAKGEFSATEESTANADS